MVFGSRRSLRFPAAPSSNLRYRVVHLRRSACSFQQFLTPSGSPSVIRRNFERPHLFSAHTCRIQKG